MSIWPVIGALATIISIGLALYERAERPKCPNCGKIMVVVVAQGSQVLVCNNCGYKTNP